MRRQGRLDRALFDVNTYIEASLHATCHSIIKVDKDAGVEVNYHTSDTWSSLFDDVLITRKFFLLNLSCDISLISGWDMQMLCNLRTFPWLDGYSLAGGPHVSTVAPHGAKAILSCS